MSTFWHVFFHCTFVVFISRSIRSFYLDCSMIKHHFLTQEESSTILNILTAFHDFNTMLTSNRDVQVLANSQIFANLYQKFANLI